MRATKSVAIAACMLGAILGMRAAFGQTPPPVDTREFICYEDWPGHLVCKDRRTNRPVYDCRKNNLTRQWECRRR